MSVSFYARRSRLMREAQEVLRGHPEFNSMLRSQMFKYAEKRGLKLDSMLNDAALANVLTKAFRTSPALVLSNMNKQALITFIEKYELIVGIRQNAKNLLIGIASVLNIDLRVEDDVDDVDDDEKD